MKLIAKNVLEETQKESDTEFDGGGSGSSNRSVFVKKTYNFITHPDLRGYAVKNYGDREFLLYCGGSLHSSHYVDFGGDNKWEITEERIHSGANFVLEGKINEISEQKAHIERKKEKAQVKKQSFFSKLFGIKS